MTPRLVNSRGTDTEKNKKIVSADHFLIPLSLGNSVPNPIDPAPRKKDNPSLTGRRVTHPGSTSLLEAASWKHRPYVGTVLI